MTSRVLLACYPLSLSRSRPGLVRRRHGQARSPLGRLAVRAAETSPDREPQQKPPLPEWILREIKRYDDSIEDARQACREQQREVDNVNKQIEELELMGAPNWVLRFMGWLRDALVKMVKMLKDQVDDMQSGREEYVQELLEAKAAADKLMDQPKVIELEPPSLEELTEEQRRRLEDPGTLGILYVSTALLMATIFTGLASLAGLDAGRLLVQPQDPMGAASTWALWTLPYLGATLLVCSLVPNLGTKRLVRASTANQKLGTVNQKFFSEVGLGSMVVMALALGGTQVVVYQGTWLQAALNFYSSSSSVGDPALVESNLRNSLGSLVATPGAALLAAPLAVLTVALIEAGWWAFENKSQSAELERELNKEVNMEGQPSLLNIWDSFHKSYKDNTPLQDTELFLLAGRVFLSSAYLTTETLVGGNLWFTVGTSATGLLASMLVARQQGRSGSP